jgi:hypothetical protein
MRGAMFFLVILIVRPKPSLARVYTIQLLCLTGKKDIVKYVRLLMAFFRPMLRFGYTFFAQFIRLALS